MEKLSKREKILLGVSIVGTGVAVGVAGYFGFKYYGAIKENKILEKSLKEANADLSIIIKGNQVLKHNVQTLMEAASEGVFEEAIGTVNNKINHRTDKKKYLLEALETRPNSDEIKQALNKVNVELKNLFDRKDKYTKAQALYEIKDEI